jgi:hypothetical protein
MLEVYTWYVLHGIASDDGLSQMKMAVAHDRLGPLLLLALQ